MFQIFNALLPSLNVRISRGLEGFQLLNLAKSAQVTSAGKGDWSRAAPFVASQRHGVLAGAASARLQAARVRSRVFDDHLSRR